MSKILKIQKPSDYSAWVGHTATHDLISVIDYSKVSPIRHSLNDYNVYGLFLQGKKITSDLIYGTGTYDYSEDTLICVAPGQIGGVEDNGELVDMSGWVVLFHPDILQGTELENGIRKFTFFDYSINEALHMTADERDLMITLIRQLDNELQFPADTMQNRIIVGLINLLLRYAQRFYNRQFVSRTIVNNDILSRFENLLNEYFSNSYQTDNGLPTIQYCSDKLCMSPNYLSDVIKRTTGDTAAHHIKRHVVQLAKNKLIAGMSCSEVAYWLGFEYPQHFTRMFKKMTGQTPSSYCNNRLRSGHPDRNISD